MGFHSIDVVVVPQYSCGMVGGEEMEAPAFVIPTIEGERIVEAHCLSASGYQFHCVVLVERSSCWCTKGYDDPLLGFPPTHELEFIHHVG